MDNLDGNGWERVCKSDIQISLGSPWIFREKHIKMAPMLVHSHSTDLPLQRVRHELDDYVKQRGGNNII